MSDLQCDHVKDVAAELALDALPGDERAAVLAHLDECAACRDLIDELSRAADDVLTALPTAEVPTDLEERIRRDARSTTTNSAPGSRSLRLLAAAAIVLVVAAGVIVLGVRSADAPDPDAGIGEFALVNPAGSTIGHVEITDDRGPQITMAIDDWDGDALFRCVVVLDDGSRSDIGYLQVTDGAGSWTGDMDHPPAEIDTAELIDESGEVAATAGID